MKNVALRVVELKRSSKFKLKRDFDAIKVSSRMMKSCFIYPRGSCKIRTTMTKRCSTEPSGNVDFRASSAGCRQRRIAGDNERKDGKPQASGTTCLRDSLNARTSERRRR